jgi:glycosyltransferase involved in cell wall biosynthesis
LDYRIINYADAVIIVDDVRREQIKETTPQRLSIIYNSPEDSNSPISKTKSPAQGTINLSYVGLFQKERGLFEILSVMKKHPKWALDMAGFGGDEEAIHAVCTELQNVNWHGTVPYEKALELSARADSLFATYDPSIPNHRYSSPNKLFEAMMLGKPIIVARDTNMDKTVSKHDCGMIVNYGNEIELEEALLKLANDPKLRKRLGDNARKAYDTHYSWNIMKSRLIELYLQVQQVHV